MRKNKIMRLAAVLLMVTLMTTSVVSGTFAKYVTQASGKDTARVAKWGVIITATGDSFATEYKTHDENYEEVFSVFSSNEEKVVAPGTSSDDVDDDFVIDIKGAPEVAVRMSIVFDEDFEDVFLKAGTYRDYTVDDADAKFTLEDDYYPLVWTLTKVDAAQQDGFVFAEGTLADIKEFVNTYVSNAEYAPNEVITSTYTLTWAWAFEQGNKDLYDKADTLLGNLAAGVATESEDNYNLKVAYGITVTATQID